MARHFVVKDKNSSHSNQDRWKVLLVNEDFMFLHAQARLLKRHGFEVRPCASYDEGKAVLEREDFDLVIVSQGSPEFEGRTVLAHASETVRKTPVLVVARQADVRCYLEAMDMGAADYFQEPLAASDIEIVKLRFLQPPIGTA
jgi:DNA-binding NtrC family response regulator